MRILACVKFYVFCFLWTFLLSSIRDGPRCAGAIPNTEMKCLKEKKKEIKLEKFNCIGGVLRHPPNGCFVLCDVFYCFALKSSAFFNP